MSEELVPSRDPWEQLDHESNAEYTAFTEYCKLGSSRTLKKLAMHMGLSHDTTKLYSRKNKWVDRAKAFDVAASSLVPDDLSLSPSETNAFHFAVGRMMLELGIRALNLKQPKSMKTTDIVKLLKEGAHLQRGALGLDNPNISISISGGKDFEAIDAMFDEVEGLEVTDENESD